MIQVIDLNKHDKFIKHNRDISIGDRLKVMSQGVSMGKFYSGQKMYLVKDKKNKCIVLYEEEVILINDYDAN